MVCKLISPKDAEGRRIIAYLGMISDGVDAFLVEGNRILVNIGTSALGVNAIYHPSEHTNGVNAPLWVEKLRKMGYVLEG